MEHIAFYNCQPRNGIIGLDIIQARSYIFKEDTNRCHVYTIYVITVSLSEFEFRGKRHTFNLHHGTHNELLNQFRYITHCFDLRLALVIYTCAEMIQLQQNVFFFVVIYLIHKNMERVIQLFLFTWITILSSAWLQIIASTPHRGMMFTSKSIIEFNTIVFLGESFSALYQFD